MFSTVLVISVLAFVAVVEVTEGNVPPCPLNDFRCLNGKCIPRQWLCDKGNDCGDNSDEEFCNIDVRSTRCPTSWFLCRNGRRCVPSEMRCDGTRNCPDHSDEDLCENVPPCTNSQFRCLSGKCISNSWVCNFANNCGDNSDEEFCNIDVRSTRCPTSWFLCGNGKRCIPGEMRCDGTTNCPDGSDEDLCGAVQFAIRNVTRKFLRSKEFTHSTNSWGSDLPRTAVALFFIDSNFFSPWNTTGDEISNVLWLQTRTKLAAKEKVSTLELSLVINALTVSCINPKDFFGVDLVAELRNRVNRSNYTNPFFILTLCTAGDSMTLTDVLKVKSTFSARLRPLWTEIQALATMAMACMSSRPDLNVDADILKEMVEELKRKLHDNGTIYNLRTTASVLQALISTGSYLSDFDTGGATKYVLRELSRTSVPFHDMYYVLLPLLNEKSLLNVSADHCTIKVEPEIDVLRKFREHPEESVQAQVSVFIGDEKDFVRKWQLKVPLNYTFYQALEYMGSVEPAYKVQYSLSEDRKPYVVGVSKFFDDAEDGKFWFIYSQHVISASEPKLLQKSPVDIQVKDDEELILWYRSEVWADPQ